MADVVFILGAGCSAHAGAPVMANFLERARDLYAVDDVGEKKAEFELTFEVISELQRVHSKARLDHNNIESVFSAVDLARTLKTLPGISPEKIEDAAKALTWLIVRTLEQSIEFETRGGYLSGTADYISLAKLIEELRGRTPPLSSAVLTFNYDVAADISFAKSNLPFTYGFAGADRGVPLLKLHGSLNWCRARKDKRIVSFNLREYDKHYQVPFYGHEQHRKTKAPMSAHAVEQLNKVIEGGVEPEPVLVPPTWSKGEYHREIGEVWRRAAAELKQARHIFVLGYSLPETDQFFRLLFALGTEGPAILNKIAIFDPNAEPVAARFREMLGNAALDRLDVNEANFGGGLNLIDSLLFATGTRRRR